MCGKGVSLIYRGKSFGIGKGASTENGDACGANERPYDEGEFETLGMSVDKRSFKEDRHTDEGALKKLECCKCSVV